MFKIIENLQRKNEIPGQSSKIQQSPESLLWRHNGPNGLRNFLHWVIYQFEQTWHKILNFSPDKVDPNSRAFEKLKNAKAFDPKRSSVLGVIHDQLKGNFTVNRGDADLGSGRQI